MIVLVIVFDPSLFYLKGGTGFLVDFERYFSFVFFLLHNILAPPPVCKGIGGESQRTKKNKKSAHEIRAVKRFWGVFFHFEQKLNRQRFASFLS